LYREMPRVSLPVLANVLVASPCGASWDTMLGGDRVRFCGDCKRDVYNLSAMTRGEAEALIAGRNGRLCVRYFQRPDGTILLDDCTVGRSLRRKRRLVAAGAAALLVAGGVASHLPRYTTATAADAALRSVPEPRAVREVSHEAPPPMTQLPRLQPARPRLHSEVLLGF
jgi:hypothetical protein